MQNINLEKIDNFNMVLTRLSQIHHKSQTKLDSSKKDYKMYLKLIKRTEKHQLTSFWRLHPWLSARSKYLFNIFIDEFEYVIWSLKFEPWTQNVSSICTLRYYSYLHSPFSRPLLSTINVFSFQQIYITAQLIT